MSTKLCICSLVICMSFSLIDAFARSGSWQEQPHTPDFGYLGRMFAVGVTSSISCKFSFEIILFPSESYTRKEISSFSSNVAWRNELNSCQTLPLKTNFTLVDRIDRPQRNSFRSRFPSPFASNWANRRSMKRLLLTPTDYAHHVTHKKQELMSSLYLQKLLFSYPCAC